MNHRRPTLDVIQVASPCTASWEQMKGDEQRRFCDHCNKFVHDLSAMPTDEAEKLVCSAAGQLCVRFARDTRSGQLITLDYRPPPRASRTRAFAVVASLLASTSVAATWVAYKLMSKPPPPPPVLRMMGEIAIPRTPAPTTQTLGKVSCNS